MIYNGGGDYKDLWLLSKEVPAQAPTNETIQNHVSHPAAIFGMRLFRGRQHIVQEMNCRFRMPTVKSQSFRDTACDNFLFCSIGDKE